MAGSLQGSKTYIFLRNYFKIFQIGVCHVQNGDYHESGLIPQMIDWLITEYFLLVHTNHFCFQRQRIHTLILWRIKSMPLGHLQNPVVFLPRRNLNASKNPTFKVLKCLMKCFHEMPQSALVRGTSTLQGSMELWPTTCLAGSPGIRLTWQPLFYDFSTMKWN